MWYVTILRSHKTLLIFQTAAAKGLLAGNLTIRRETDTVLHVLNEKEV
jgi:hypothetical protein